MLRAARLTALHEARLLARDPVVLLMLLLAPVVIITLAGYSLGALYGGGASVHPIPVVDRDGGDVGRAVVDGVGEVANVDRLADVAAARARVRRADGPPLAIVVPAGASDAVAAGRALRLVVYVDAAKRVEADAVEVRLAELCRRIEAAAQARAQARLDAATADLRRAVAGVRETIAAERARVQAALARARDDAAAAVRRQLAHEAARAEARVRALVRAREADAWDDVAAQLAARRAEVEALQARLRDARAAAAAFADWLARLRALAGSHADDIPPPPAFPPLPSDAELAALAAPLTPPATPALPPLALAPPAIEVALPDAARADPAVDVDALAPAAVALPGTVGLVERPASAGSATTANAFDQYVPGFGVTFLLIGMMMGVALTLFDERDWGTLQRLRAGGASLAGMLAGKLATRFAVGVVQMAVLLAVGRLLFGISLGRTPAALLLPSIGIAFAAAGLGLVVAALAATHDGVMPLGTMVSMAMAAVGGCWWPIGFEPTWMRGLAQVLPTTWTMQAFNDLMIRHLPAASAAWPFACTMALGLAYVALGLTLHLRRAT